MITTNETFHEPEAVTHDGKYSARSRYLVRELRINEVPNILDVGFLDVPRILKSAHIIEERVAERIAPAPFATERKR